ncbi:16527_t:CDS:2 [Entrophospora sp. SA101]|nr:16527_t:CDS:2 [Entrophospora sp. SA101]CAJ0840616.1 18584_t:CDS:2 [Entrophospora sp. SA101]
MSLDSSSSKTDYNFLVCGGAAGIVGNPPIEWSHTHFLYMLLDFVNGVHLTDFDQNLSGSIIIGLCIAYYFFARDKLSFDTFKYAAQPHINAFNVNLVLDRIRNSLNLQSNQQLFILLHIDEYQEIFDFENNNFWKIPSSKGLFKELMYVLGPLMTEKRLDYYVQTFLSGTAPQDVTREKEPTSYSFAFVKCPMLTITAILNIFDYFANKNGDRQQHWMASTPFLQLLYDTGGLPRALQYVIEKSLAIHNFFNELQNGKFTFFDSLFAEIVNTLNQKYNIRSYVRKNLKVSLQILYHCIGAIPTQFNKNLDINTPQLTVEKMERDGYLILKPHSDLDYLIEMPFYFFYLYNMELNIAPAILHKKFQPNSDMYWEEWENFVAQFEVIHNNLLVDMGTKEIKLRDYYCGGIGRDDILDIQIKLEKLNNICIAKNQFPKSGQPIRSSDNFEMSFESNDILFINGKAAPFADIFLVQQTSKSQKIIMGLQEKWHNFSDPITIMDIENECKKNSAAIAKSTIKNLKDYHIITIIFTSQHFNKEDVKKLPNDCLIIARDNFEQCFGPVFSSRLAFNIMGKLNLNFAKPQQISNLIKGIGTTMSSSIFQKRPYYGVEDVIKKNGENFQKVQKRTGAVLIHSIFISQQLTVNYNIMD